jgi:O-antigen ligase
MEKSAINVNQIRGTERAVDRACRLFTTGAAAATFALLPLIVSPAARDTFRLPKDHLLAGGGFLVLGGLICRAILNPPVLRQELSRVKLPAALSLLVLSWTLIVTALSTNIHLSILSLVHVTAYFALFLAALLGARRAGMSAIWILLAPALINAIVLFLQASRLWNPFYGSDSGRITGLIGNPNWLGAYLLPSALISSALAFTSKRISHALVALTLTVALLLTYSAGAIGAWICGFLTMAFLQSKRAAVMAFVSAGLLTGGAILAYEPLAQRLTSFGTAVQRRDFNQLSSHRLTAFLVAFEMFRDRPLLGQGPGTYAWHYFDLKIAAERDHPQLRNSGDRVFIFGEAHSDHLQTMAVAGLPGFVLLLGSLAYLGSLSWTTSTSATGPTSRFIRFSSFPVAMAATLFMIVQFPLQLAAPAMVLVFFAAVASDWSRHA